MLDLASPTTFPRYLSEVRVLLGIRTRPICLHGAPLATVDELCRYLESWGHAPALHASDPQQLVVGDHTLILFGHHRLTLASLRDP
jgi:hypothetical protein